MSTLVTYEQDLENARDGFDYYNHGCGAGEYNDPGLRSGWNRMAMMGNNEALEGASGSYVSLLTRLVFDEPVVERAIHTMVQHCMGDKLRCTVDNRPVTEAFDQFLDHNYVPFLYDAIRSMLITGFVPWRIRKANKYSNDLVPEVLPFGTYSWYVERSEEAQKRRERESNKIMREVRHNHQGVRGLGGQSQPSNEKSDDKKSNPKQYGPNVQRGRPMGNKGLMHEPFLRYEVRAVNSDLATPSYRMKEHDGKDIAKLLFVYETTRPTGVLQCNSPLCGCLAAYVRLINTRECLRRANLFNSTGKVAIVHQPEKTLTAANITGRDLLGDTYAMNDPLEDSETAKAKSQQRDATTTQRAIDLSRIGARKPDAVTLPKGMDVKGMPNAVTPQSIEIEEEKFTQAVCHAIGIPAGMLQQQRAAGLNAGGGDAQMMQNRTMLQESSGPFTRHACRVAELAYLAIYHPTHPDSPLVHMGLIEPDHGTFDPTATDGQSVDGKDNQKEGNDPKKAKTGKEPPDNGKPSGPQGGPAGKGAPDDKKNPKQDEKDDRPNPKEHVRWENFFERADHKEVPTNPNEEMGDPEKRKKRRYGAGDDGQPIVVHFTFDNAAAVDLPQIAELFNNNLVTDNHISQMLQRRLGFKLSENARDMRTRRLRAERDELKMKSENAQIDLMLKKQQMLMQREQATMDRADRQRVIENEAKDRSEAKAQAQADRASAKALQEESRKANAEERQSKNRERESNQKQKMVELMLKAGVKLSREEIEQLTGHAHRGRAVPALDV